MPQIQVIGKERVDTQNAQLDRQQKEREMMNTLQDKIVTAKLFHNELKLKEKTAGDEREKTRLGFLASKADTFTKMLELAGKQPTAKGSQNTMVTYMKMFPEMLPELMENGLADLVKNLEPTAESQQQASVAAQNLAMADIIKRQTMGGGGGATADGGQGMVQPGVGNRANALGGDYLMSQFDSSGKTTFESPSIKSYLISQETAARKRGEKSAALEGAKKALAEFASLNTDLERGKGAGRFLAGAGNAAAGFFQTGSKRGTAASTYSGAEKQLGTSVARIFDVGNLNKNEQDAARQLVPTMNDSQLSYDRKMLYLNNIVRAFEEGGSDASDALVRQYTGGMSSGNINSDPLGLFTK